MIAKEVELKFCGSAVFSAERAPTDILAKTTLTDFMTTFLYQVFWKAFKFFVDRYIISTPKKWLESS